MADALAAQQRRNDPMNLDPQRVKRVMDLCLATQEKTGPNALKPDMGPHKTRAKERAAEILYNNAGKGIKIRTILDVGGEPWYWPFFQGAEMHEVNLPQEDFHQFDHGQKYDAALAMHVLEHSPFPALVLENIRVHLKKKGLLYVAVPHCTPKWLAYDAHVTMQPPTAWVSLLQRMGFTVRYRGWGAFGRSRHSVEERILCQL